MVADYQLRGEEKSNQLLALLD
uniref:Uncharacterized protein n=1 Tax=Arundo donax TaxID=35708 RepID=A0A0A8Z4P5_ARUDO